MLSGAIRVGEALFNKVALKVGTKGILAISLALSYLLKKLKTQSDKRSQGGGGGGFKLQAGGGGGGSSSHDESFLKENNEQKNNNNNNLSSNDSAPSNESQSNDNNNNNNSNNNNQQADNSTSTQEDSKSNIDNNVNIDNGHDTQKESQAIDNEISSKIDDIPQSVLDQAYNISKDLLLNDAIDNALKKNDLEGLEECIEKVGNLFKELEGPAIEEQGGQEDHKELLDDIFKKLDISDEETKETIRDLFDNEHGKETDGNKSLLENILEKGDDAKSLVKDIFNVFNTAIHEHENKHDNKNENKNDNKSHIQEENATNSSKNNNTSHSMSTKLEAIQNSFIEKHMPNAMQEVKKMSITPPTTGHQSSNKQTACIR